jgi:hypothetical protein
VTVQTVCAALGSEVGIIKTLLAEMEGDAQAPVWRERTAAADEPAAKLRAFAGWTTGILSASRRAITTAEQAGGYPAVTEPKAVGDRGRRDRASTALSH